MLLKASVIAHARPSFRLSATPSGEMMEVIEPIDDRDDAAVGARRAAADRVELGADGMWF